MENKKVLTTEQHEDAKRLKALYESKKKQLGITQYGIAEALEISQGAVGHYLNGRIPLNLNVAAKFAEMLQISINDFSPRLARDASKLGLLSNVVFDSRYKSSPSYPLISWVNAGAWEEAYEPYTLEGIDEWYESDAHIEGAGFWLKVEGDSMTAPAGISIPEGTMVLIDTGREPKNGNLVIAKQDDANEATFKKLIIDGAHKYLKGLNPAWPMIPIGSNCRIIGVAVETKMRLL
ncbi:LexA family transcriptional regulator [Pantoea sp. BAV 3049]|uniref:LexA family protein n=1 Tax=Pantoea sp. BAV 3049 TaxID=2654188 RepID=UPI00131D5737|nr:XRE family transcriptional regulator [Pantoea sp. BAV 3049]